MYPWGEAEKDVMVDCTIALDPTGFFEDEIQKGGIDQAQCARSILPTRDPAIGGSTDDPFNTANRKKQPNATGSLGSVVLRQHRKWVSISDEWAVRSKSIHLSRPDLAPVRDMMCNQADQLSIPGTRYVDE
ncbi:MAG: hypothetical protein AAF666_02985 [Pseudomonadota bacterium]